MTLLKVRMFQLVGITYTSFLCLRSLNLSLNLWRLTSEQQSTVDRLIVASLAIKEEGQSPATSSTARAMQLEQQTKSCPTEGSFEQPHNDIMIDFNAVKASSKSRIDEIKQFTFLKYEKHMMSNPGLEHYALLHYLTKTYGDCRHVTDIGTRYVASALALSASGSPAWTFDLPTSRERMTAFRDKTESEWQAQVQTAGCNITFHNVDLLNVPDQAFRKYMTTWLIVLDTHHLPYTVPFEREFISRIVAMGFEGILLLDDIHLNAEMTKWWAELKDNAANNGYVVHDVTPVGHYSGTGLLDFTGKVKIIQHTNDEAARPDGDKLSLDEPKTATTAGVDVSDPSLKEGVDLHGDSSTATVMGLASGYQLDVYEQFVGSLRKSGFKGHIILGVAPDVPAKVLEYFQYRDVTPKIMEWVNCTYRRTETESKNDIFRKSHCAHPYPDIKIRWSRFPLQRDWLQECESCTGPVLVADVRDTFFQSDPFGVGSPVVEGLQVFEEHKNQTTDHWLTQWPINDCKGITFTKTMLCSGTTVGTRAAMLKYLEAMYAEMKVWINDPKCRFDINGDDQSIHNYLFYTGQLPFATAIPNRQGGIVNTPGVEGSELVEKHAAAKMEKHGLNRSEAMKMSFEGASGDRWIGEQFNMVDAQGFFTEFDGSRSRVIHQWDRFGKPFVRWMSQHPGLFRDPIPQAIIFNNATTTTTTDDTSSPDLKFYQVPELQRPLRDVPPMTSSFTTATAVERAPWFAPPGRTCKETCCWEQIAVSMDQEAHRIKNTVDGLDLADVLVHGHRLPDHLEFHATELNEDIIPCLQDGTIIHVDSYGHSIDKFFLELRPNITIRYVLLTTETDGATPLERYTSMLREDALMLKWYGNNPSPPRDHQDKFVGFPLGLSKYHPQMPYLTRYLEVRNFSNPFHDKSRWIKSAALFDPTNDETTDVLFVKFGINEHSQHRKVPFAFGCNGRLRQSAWNDSVSCTLGGNFTMHETYAAASRYLFGLSPPGNGQDCHRNYELFMLGVIPVVVDKLGFANEMWKDLPVVRLDGWNFTQHELLEKLQKYVQSREFAETNFGRGWERLFLGYWRRRVLKDAGRESDIIRDENGREYYLAWKYTKNVS